MNFLRSRRHLAGAVCLVGLLVLSAVTYVAKADGQAAPQPTAPFSDYRVEKAGVMHRITVADLPKPFATEAANNGPKLCPGPKGRRPWASPATPSPCMRTASRIRD